MNARCVSSNPCTWKSARTSRCASAKSLPIITWERVYWLWTTEELQQRGARNGRAVPPPLFLLLGILLRRREKDLIVHSHCGREHRRTFAIRQCDLFCQATERRAYWLVRVRWRISG